MCHNWLWILSASWGCVHAWSLVTDANPQLSGSKTAQPHTPIMEISHKGGWGGLSLSLSLVHTMFPWQQHWQELRLAQAVIRSGNVCGVSSAEMLRSHGVSALSAFGLWLSGWSFLLLHCKAKSTLNMSLVRLSHAEEGGGKIGEEGRGGKAPQETNPSSVGGRDANPQWKSVVSVSHTLSVSGSLLSRLTVSFTSVFFFPSLHLYLCTPLP